MDPSTGGCVASEGQEQPDLGKLPSWAPRGEIEESGADQTIFTLQNEKDNPHLRGGKYSVPHYGDQAFGRCFGPLALDQVLSFCIVMERLLDVHGEVKVTPSTADIADYRNTAVLYGGFLIIQRGWSGERVVKTLPKEAELVFPCSWSRDANQPPVLKVQDCWMALAMALRLGWISSMTLRDSFGADLICQQYRRIAYTYDAAWIVPGRILVSADPMSTIRDPNPATVQDLVNGQSWSVDQLRCPSEEALDASKSTQGHQPSQSRIGSETSLNTSHASRNRDGASAAAPTLPVVDERLPTSRFKSQTSNLERRLSRTFSRKKSLAYETDSVHTVCKEYQVNGDSNLGENVPVPIDFASWLKLQGVGLIARVNFGNEPGLREHGGSYDPEAFRSAGFEFVDLPFEDINGAIPERSKVSRFFEEYEKSCTEDQCAVLVHCKGGFGRSVMFCCLLAIRMYNVPGREVLAWVRVARPGAITTLAQERFLCGLAGRRDLEDWMNARSCCAVM